MVLAIEPGVYWPGGGGLRLEDNFHITDQGNEKLCSDPDDFRLAYPHGKSGTQKSEPSQS
jgi:Xaa-Pro aminopeptidase